MTKITPEASLLSGALSHSLIGCERAVQDLFKIQLVAATGISGTKDTASACEEAGF